MGNSRPPAVSTSSAARPPPARRPPPPNAMPTHDPGQALGLEAALERVRAQAFPLRPDPEATGVGLEQERFVVECLPDGSPGRRLPLAGPGGVVEAIRTAAEDDPLLLPIDPRRQPPVVALAGGGTLTFEPGAQIEHSTGVHTGASQALDDVHRVVVALERVFAGKQVRLVALGIDPWHGPQQVPQQLDAPRYRAMAAYFDRRGPAGPWMMRLSCSLQVNLDYGQGLTLEERWALANLLSPALTALFSTSPGEMDGRRWRSRRGRVWQTIDPTRSGIPKHFLESPELPPAEQYARAALDADVLLVRTADGGAEPGQPGWRMRDWIEGGHPQHGWPTAEDLDYHLTTLFFEARARGFLELRAVDALPYCWRPAPVALLTGLLYDPRARGEALERLWPKRERVEDLWQRAAALGLEDPEVRADATALMELGLEGAGRLGETFWRPAHLAAATAFAERFSARGAAPADELEVALAAGPAQALEWAMSSGCGADEVALVEGARPCGGSA